MALMILVVIVDAFGFGHAYCASSLQGDGVCDKVCMTANSAFDSVGTGLSDCLPLCTQHCSASELADTVCQDHCNTWDCEWDRGDCAVCASGCLVSQLGDGTCQPECLSSACGWDWGDCNDQLHPLDTFVSAGGLEGDGSVGAPLNDLLQTLLELFLPFNRIVLQGGTHLLNTEDMNFPELLSQRGLINTVITGSLDSIPTIKLTRHFAGFRISHSVIFSYIYFDGAFDLRENCWEPTCLYCPFTTFDSDREEWVNDRNQVIDIAKFAPQTYCNEYHDKVFITVTEDASLTLENVTFANFNQQLKALILNECGNLYLRSVHFDRCMADPSGAGLIQHTISESRLPYNCGEIEYVGGSVYRLNDGYEYRSDVVFSGFLRIEGIQLLKVSGVDFALSNVMAGEAVEQVGSTFPSLLNLQSFRQLIISNCTFSISLFATSLLSIQSHFHYPLPSPSAPDAELLHISITNCTFSSIFIQTGSLLLFHYKGDHPNISFQQLHFTENYSQLGLITITYETADNTELSGGIRTIEVSHISAVSNAFSHFFSLQNAGNISLTNSEIRASGDSANDTMSSQSVTSRYIESPQVYLSQLFAEENAVVCAGLITFNSVQSAVLGKNTVSGNKCLSGVYGLLVYGTGRDIRVNSAYFHQNQGVGIRSLSTAAISLTQLHCVGNANTQNRYGACIDLRPTASGSNVQLSDSNFANNTAWFGPALYSEDLASLSLSQVRVSSNTAIHSCAGVFFSPPHAGKSAVSITKSEFSWNSGKRYGAITVTAANGEISSVVDVNIADSQFQENWSGMHGASVSLVSIELSAESAISACSFVSSESAEGAAVFAQFDSGQFTLSQSQFTGNRCRRGAVFLSHSGAQSTVRITKCEFRAQVLGPAVEAQGATDNSQVEASWNLFDTGFSAFLLTATTLRDESSVYRNLRALEGAVAFAQTKSVLVVVNASACGNVATNRGGVFYITAHSSLRAESSHFSANSASVSGGVVFADEDSHVSLLSSNFSENSAKIASVLYASPANISVWNCSFQRNHAEDYSCVLIAHCTALIAFSSFRNNTSSSAPGLVLTACNVTITDTEMSDQKASNGGFLQAIDHSTVVITRSRFVRGVAIALGGAVFGTLQSTLSLSFSAFEDCASGHEGGAISLQNCELYVTNCSFLRTKTKNSGAAISIRDSNVDLYNTLFQASGPSPVYLSGVYIATVKDCRFTGGFSNNAAGIIVKNVIVLRVEGCTFTQNSADFVAGAIRITSDATMPTRDQIFLVRNEFYFNRAKGRNGGAVFSADVDLYLERNLFKGNNAGGKGGALALSCDIWDWCNVTAVDNLFVENTSAKEGGAVAWSGSFPTLSSNHFSGNSAPYGSDIASYAVQLSALSLFNASVPYLSTHDSLPVALRITEVASGQMYKGEIALGLFDHSGQLLATNRQSGCSLSPLNSSALSLSGSTSTEAAGGICTFAYVTIAGAPGSTQFLLASTSGVDPSLHFRARDLAEYHEKVLIEVHFRHCVSGEVVQRAECFLCTKGTFSLDPNTPCLLCPSAAICYGNNTMVPKPGFWRYSNDTANFIECLAPEACIGSPDPPFLSLTGLCASGYTGNLCSQCSDNYSRTGKFSCVQCPSLSSNIAMTVLLLLFSLLVGAAVISIAIRTAQRPQSLIAVYVKIFMNYLQMVVVSASLNLKWPTSARAFLDGQEMAGGMVDHLFSIDCLLQEMGKSNKDLYFLQVRLYAVLPAALFLPALSAWGALALCANVESLSRKIAATAVIIVFALHPSVTKSMFSMFACMDIGDGRMWLVHDLETQCWGTEHLQQIFTVVLPTLIVFVFSLPLLALATLIVKRSTLESAPFKLVYCFLYKGFHRPRFYWEFVILYRKVAMIAAAVFLAPVSVQLQALTVLALLLFALYLQVRISPFFEQSLNGLEVKAISVSALTVYSGLYYSTSDLSFWLKMTLFAVIICANAYFLLHWLRLVSPALIRSLKARFAHFSRVHNYRIQAITTVRTAQERASSGDVSSDFTNPQCSANDPSSYIEPPNTSVVMQREYTLAEEGKDRVQYAFVEGQ